MFFAHLPAGYLLTRGLLTARGAADLADVERRRLMAAGLVASVLPDFDLAYALLAHSNVSHRAFLTHAPLAWLALATGVAVLAWSWGRPDWQRLNLAVLANVWLHLALDTVAAPVRWLYPFSGQWFELVRVPYLAGLPWYLSFMAHWTLLIELAIVATALAVWRRDQRVGSAA